MNRIGLNRLSGAHADRHESLQPPSGGSRLWNGVAEMAKQRGVAALLPVPVHEMLSGDTRMRQPNLVAYLLTMCLETRADPHTDGSALHRVLAAWR